MSIWAGAGSVASWAVEIEVNSSSVILDQYNQPLPIIELKIKPRPTLANEGSTFQLVDARLVSRIPNNATFANSTTGFWFLSSSVSPGEIGTQFLIYDPSTDTIYIARNPNSIQVSQKVTDLFLSSSVYQFLRWPYVTKGAVDPDLEGVQEKITGGMLPMLLLLLGCGIGLKLLDYGSIKLMRFWDDKDSQRALARINNIEDPLEHKVALEAHRKAYNARFKRYAKEDRQRRRR